MLGHAVSLFGHTVRSVQVVKLPPADSKVFAPPVCYRRIVVPTALLDGMLFEPVAPRGITWAMLVCLYTCVGVCALTRTSEVAVHTPPVFRLSRYRCRGEQLQAGR